MISEELKELIVLLDYGESAGNICSRTLAEVANFSDLKFIFEEIIKFYLVSTSTTTRINASITLNRLCRRFSHELADLLSLSASDGRLLTLEHLDLQHLYDQRDAIELLSGRSFLSTLNENVHTKSWLRKCRRLLHERLGWESGAEDLSTALQFFESESDAPLLDSNDILEGNHRTGNALNSNNGMSEDVAEDDGVSGNCDGVNNDDSSEAWIARLVRYMTVGLLDPCWESRHGCALGLVSVLTGTLSSFASSEDVVDTDPKDSLTLPVFLIEDILCHGLCTLLLDCFIDLGYSSSSLSSQGINSSATSTSPVKEAVGLLLARVSHLYEQSASTRMGKLAPQIFTRLSWISSRGLVVLGEASSSSAASLSTQTARAAQSTGMYHRDWVVRQGGLIALKHFVTTHFTTLSEDDALCAQLRALCEAGLRDSADDVRNAAVGVFLALGHLCTRSSDFSVGVGTDIDARMTKSSTLLWSLTDALLHSIRSLDPLSVCALSLCRALTCLSLTLPVANNESDSISAPLRLRTLMLLQSELTSKLHLFSASTRHSCLLESRNFLENVSNFIQSHKHVSSAGCSENIFTHVSADVAYLTVSTMRGLLRNLTSAACADLGDLHLTSQYDQDKKTPILATNDSKSVPPTSSVLSTDIDNYSAGLESNQYSIREPAMAKSETAHLVITSANMLFIKRTLSAELGALIGDILLTMTMKTEFLSGLTLALITDSCTFADLSQNSSRITSAEKSLDVSAARGGRSKRRKVDFVESEYVDEEFVDTRLISALDRFLASKFSEQIRKYPAEAMELYSLSATNFTGVFPDKYLCQFAEFVSGLVSCCPAAHKDLANGLLRIRDDVTAAVKSITSKVDQDVLGSQIVKKIAPKIRMRLVEGDDITSQKQVACLKPANGASSAQVQHAVVLSVLSWLSVSLQVVGSPHGNLSEYGDTVSTLVGDWESGRYGKGGRAFWQAGFLHTFGSGQLQVDLQVNWIQRAVAAALPSRSEEAVIAMCDHFSYLLLSLLFPSSKSKYSTAELPSRDAISKLCILIELETTSGRLLFNDLFRTIAQEMGAVLISSHRPSCVQFLCTNLEQGVSSDASSAFSSSSLVQALGFISITLPIIRDEEACKELLLGSPLLRNVLLYGSIHKVSARVVVSTLTRAVLHKPALSRLLWIRLLEHIHQSITSNTTNEVTKSYHASLLYESTLRVPEEDLTGTYDYWLRACLHGSGSYHQAARQAAIAAFRNIIPLAAVAMQQPQDVLAPASDPSSSCNSKNLNSESVGVLSQVLSRSPVASITHSKNSLDIAIMQALTALDWSILSPLATRAGMPRLRPYQLDGVTWLTHLRRCGLAGCLADEMGLGKSAQALIALMIMRIESIITGDWINTTDLTQSHLLEDALTRSSAAAAPCLVVCPASVVSHWEAETRKFVPASILTPRRFTGKDDKFDGSCVVIASYDQLRTHMNKFLFEPQSSNSTSEGKKLRVWAAVVADEAHLIKNPASKTAQCVFQLKSHFRVAISGTPIQNNLEELWSVFNFLLPDFLGAHRPFMKEVVRPVQQSMLERRKLLSLEASQARNAQREEGKHPSNERERKLSIAAEGIDILRKLHKQVLPFILHRTKAVVAADIPSKTVVDVLCPLSDVQRQLYTEFLTDSQWTDTALETEFRALTGDENDTNNANTMSSTVVESKPRRVHPFQALQYLKLLCIHPSLVIDTDHAAYRRRLVEELASSTKMLHLADLLVKSGVVLQDEISGPFDQLSAALQARLVGEKVVISANRTSGNDDEQSSASDNDNDEEDEEDKEEDVEEEEDGSAVVPRDGVHSSSSTTNTATVTVPTTKRRSARVAVLQACKRGKTDKIESVSVPHEAAPSRVQSRSGTAYAHKCLIFSTHRAVLDVIETTVLKRYFSSVKYARLDGSVSPSQRGDLAATFNDRSSDTRILLLTKSCCGLGLNLTGADTVVFVEHDFNPFVDLQAMDRAHRIGQDRPVTVYRIIGMDTIEARIMSLQSFKRDIVSEIVDERNAHSFGGGQSSTEGVRSSTSEVPSGHIGQHTDGGFEGALWSSVKGRATSDVTGSTSDPIGRYQSRSRTYQMWMQEEYEDADLNKFVKSLNN